MKTGWLADMLQHPKKETPFKAACFKTATKAIWGVPQCEITFLLISTRSVYSWRWLVMWLDATQSLTHPPLTSGPTGLSLVSSCTLG